MLRVKPDTKRKIKHRTRLSTEWHSHQLILYFSLFGSAILFIFVLIAFFATQSIVQEFYFSKYFSYSTVILLLSALPASRLTTAFDAERGKQIIRNLSTLVFAGFLFSLLQYAGWSQLNDVTNELNNRSASFLYLLSILHAIHVASVIAITIYVGIRIKMKLSNPIDTLVYYTNPYQRMKLGMISQTWLFLHMIWVVIYLVFMSQSY